MSTTATDPRIQRHRDRWYTLDPHVGQGSLFHSEARFCVAACGRRSGKTELAKRRGVHLACYVPPRELGRWVFAAPTRKQAKEIFWEDVKVLTPPNFIDKISESTCTIHLINGHRIQVDGLDRPQRIEGSPLDWICLDEMADVKENSFTRHVRPALDTRGRQGCAWMIGVPRGRGYFYKVFQRGAKGKNADWEAFNWPSSDILSPEVVAAARDDLDPLTFEQEYEASFLSFEGRVYYGFDRHLHARDRVVYRPDLPLVFAFDFNVSPGVAVVLQEQMYEGSNPRVPKDNPITAVIGEVWIPQNSNTEFVCNKLLEDWGHHTGLVYCYGDASGGARKTSALQGDDWKIMGRGNSDGILRRHFRDRLKFRIRKANPAVRVRINSVNARVMTAGDLTEDGRPIPDTGKIRTLIDPVNAEHLVDDLEGVTWLDGGADIDKSGDKWLTHISDAFGYYCERAHPLKAVPTLYETMLT